MYEDDALNKLGVVGEWIWGDDEETAVFAQAYGHGRTLIFQFASDQGRPFSLPSRIVNCYHDVQVTDPNASFADRPSMRAALWLALSSIWPDCIESPQTAGSDVIIDVGDAGSEEPEPQISWVARHDARFNDYLDILSPIDQLSLQQPTDTIDFKALVRQNQLGGRGCATLVTTASCPQSQFVFKGIDFRTYLIDYESGHILDQVKTFYRAVKLVDGMPHHPNVKVPAPTLVTIRKPGDHTELVCGTLEAFFPGGTLKRHIEEFNTAGQRIPLSQKVLWCHQMAAAVAHTHLVAHTYHMDIKPGNFLIDENQKLVLIDWEQNDAPATTAAPEIDGSWDVEQSADGSLLYTKYAGPERRNMPDTTPGQRGWNVWNCFPVWAERCPKAAELAEVFSVGRCMWMLLRQPETDFEGIENTQDILEDWTGCEDIPESFKRAVEKCVDHDPNKRMGLEELVAFWENAKQAVEA
ncbi:Protein kinase-like protein [Drechmeria coniospora]|uniref:Protein kinase-like protein n=1 Tax=Drechmeria coniospora TaxID=98403 RepID=A0A151GRY0_DRECN|nr:Protein kinase-like protein [Drechmeria coniospora]KYK59811.1 Protein kinase-like protein [Drechmeria coniospora]ODA78610.1 hypothetical protein RJ55_05992 [Drechmeria coniospora]